MGLYRQKNCLPLCLQDYLRENCGCIDGSLPIINKNISICDSLIKLKCVKDKKVEYFENETLTDKCYTQCPLECDSSMELFKELI